LPADQEVTVAPTNFEPIVSAVRPRAEPSALERVPVKNLEFSMQAVVDRVMRALTLKHPISDQEAEAIRREATEFAINLLAKYKSQLAQRTLSGASER
jgi:hypothetical protein